MICARDSLSRKTSQTLVCLILLGFALRVYHLGWSSLRGDEAFAVRYWAVPPGAVLQGPAGEEPHPLGTFLSFWLWKSLAGSSEFAMRLLPALINLLGIPAIYGISRRLFSDRTTSQRIGLL